MARRAPGALALFLLVTIPLWASGCGPQAAVWLQVGAPLRIPEDVDALEVVARWGGAQGGVAFEQTYALDPQLAFPVTLSLTADEARPGEVLWVEARALKEGALARSWSHAAGEVVLERAEMTELALQMCDCDGGE